MQIRDAYALVKSEQDPSFIKQCLDGTWQLRNSDGQYSLEAQVPGEVHTALLAAGIIEDPYFGERWIEYKWIFRDNWTYSRDFIVDKRLYESDKIGLICHGLDTIAEISINGTVVGRADNQFRRWDYNVKKALQYGTNTIAISFQDASAYGAELARQYPYPVPEAMNVETQQGEPGRNFVRKETCAFSWDWGPAFVPQGISKCIELVGITASVCLKEVVPIITKEEDKWIVTIRVFSTAVGDVDGIFVASVAGVKVETKVELKDGRNVSHLKIHVPESAVSLWWPIGYGLQPLYELKLSFHQHLSNGVTVAMHSVLKRVGFRTARLVQEPYPDQDEPGESFYFEINGIPIFAKGSNVIPADAFESRVTGHVWRHLLQSCADANYNMIRVWGGGIYQPSEFYALCDELGLLVWQEFMFACALYPTNDEFLENVREEARDNVRRLAHHPSVVLWSGNNENEESLLNKWYGDVKENPYIYTVDYHVLYHSTILPVLKEEDPSRSFVSSSPSNGAISKGNPWQERYIGNSEKYGDVHYYNYKDLGTDPTRFLKPRFASEYGFQSVPTFATLQVVDNAKEEDWRGEWLRKRNHAPDGMNTIANMVQKYFNLPGSFDAVARLDHFSYLSQIVQALIYQAQTEHYRRLRGDPQVNCMGALYWQCNDIWQAPTWASIEYGGNWKILHSFAKKFFAPILVSSIEDPRDGSYEVHVINDTLEELDVAVDVAVYSYTTSALVRRATFRPTIIPALSSRLVHRANTVLELFDNPAASYTDRLILLTARNAHLPLGSPVISSNIHYPAFFTQDVRLRNPNIQVVDVQDVTDLRDEPQQERREKVTGRQKWFRASLQALDAIALFVFLETGVELPAVFDDNGFVLLKGQRLEIDFVVSESHMAARGVALASNTTGLQVLKFNNVDVEAVKSRIKVRSLYSSIV